MHALAVGARDFSREHYLQGLNRSHEYYLIMAHEKRRDGEAEVKEGGSNYLNLKISFLHVCTACNIIYGKQGHIRGVKKCFFAESTLQLEQNYS